MTHREAEEAYLKAWREARVAEEEAQRLWKIARRLQYEWMKGEPGFYEDADGYGIRR